MEIFKDTIDNLYFRLYIQIDLYITFPKHWVGSTPWEYAATRREILRMIEIEIEILRRVS